MTPPGCNGTVLITPTTAEQIGEALQTAGVTYGSLNRALYKEYLGDSTELVAITTEITAIAVAHGVTDAQVIDEM